MADNNSATMNSNNPNQIIKAEQAKAELSRRGQSSTQSQTGEQGRAHDEIGSSHPADKPEAFKNDRGSDTPR